MGTLVARIKTVVRTLCALRIITPHPYTIGLYYADMPYFIYKSNMLSPYTSNWPQ